MTKKQKKDTIDLDINEAIKIKDRIINISEKLSSEKDKEDLIAASHLLELVITLYSTWSNSKKKMNKILKMFFGNRSEKLSVITKKTASGDGNVEGEGNDSKGKVLDEPKTDANNDESGSNAQDEKEESEKTGRTGKNPASDYTGASEITCSLGDNHRPGVLCPKCKRNKLFETEPKKTIRLVGHAPVSAFKFIMQKSRCICGSIFTATPPLEFEELYNGDKYSPSALSSIVIYKYLLGSSFGSLEKIQSMAGIPLPSSTQANKIRDMIVPVVESIIEVLKYLAANAYALGFDDTTIKLLTEKRLTKKDTLTNKGHGTAVVATDFDLGLVPFLDSSSGSGSNLDSNSGSNTIILYDFDYNKHAGDVMMNLLSLRERSDFPLLISDGLVSYDQCKKEGIDVNCNAHARRKIVEEDPTLESYVGQIIINCYKEIYKHEKYCKLNDIQKERRMKYHIENSSYYFSKITTVFELIKGDISQEEKDLSIKTFEFQKPIFPSEPNDDLYKAANYFLNRKESLTAILSIPGAPLDTNYVERVIKSIIKIRRNSQFFENLESAKYSGNILSLLETTNFNKINAFIYTEFLLENKNEVLKNPKYFLPWIYNKSDSEKEAYWKGVNHLIHGGAKGGGFNCTNSQPPSSSSEYQSSSQSHSYKSSVLRGSG